MQKPEWKQIAITHETCNYVVFFKQTGTNLVSIGRSVWTIVKSNLPVFFPQLTLTLSYMLKLAWQGNAISLNRLKEIILVADEIVKTKVSQMEHIGVVIGMKVYIFTCSRYHSSFSRREMYVFGQSYKFVEPTVLVLFSISKFNRDTRSWISFVLCNQHQSMSTSLELLEESQKQS